MTYFWSKVYNQLYVLLIIILFDFFKEGDSDKRGQKMLTAANLLQLQRSEVILDTNKNYRGYSGHKQKLELMTLAESISASIVHTQLICSGQERTSPTEYIYIGAPFPQKNIKVKGAICICDEEFQEIYERAGPH